MEAANTTAKTDNPTTPLIDETAANIVTEAPPQQSAEATTAPVVVMAAEESISSDNTTTTTTTSPPQQQLFSTSTALLEPDNLTASDMPIVASAPEMDGSRGADGDRPEESLLRSDAEGSNPDMDSGSAQLSDQQSPSTIIRIAPIAYTASGRFMAQVVGSETHFGGDGDHTVYEMEVKDNETGITSIVFHRYSEFLVFFTRLAARYPELLTEIKFPPKRWFGNNAEKVIRERMAGFNVLIQHLCTNEKYSNDADFLDFIKSDMVMIKKALNYFRAKLYAYRQQKEDNLNKEAVRMTEMKIKMLDQSLKRVTDQVCLSITSRVRSRTVHTTHNAHSATGGQVPQSVHAKEV